MSTDNADAALARLADSIERVRANLLEFDLNGDVKLLEQSPLAGETAALYTAPADVERASELVMECQNTLTLCEVKR